MMTMKSHSAYRLFSLALLAVFLYACAQVPITTADPDFSKGYEEGRVAARKDAAGYRCFKAKRNLEGSVRLMKYDEALVAEQRSDAYIQGFRMGFRRYFNYYVDFYCPDLSMFP
jgi:hypothetical protein